MDLAVYPRIAGCAGGFTVQGVHQDHGATCSLQGGNHGPLPDGTTCSATDLCALGWHVCATPQEVMSRSYNGCAGSLDVAQPSFFVTRQSGTGCLTCSLGTVQGCFPGDCNVNCADAPELSNDLFGCGTLGAPVTQCGGLDRSSHNSCSSLGGPWNCPDNAVGNGGFHEADLVNKPGSSGGGVLCCQDGP